MDDRAQARKIRYYRVLGQGWSRAYVYCAVAAYAAGTHVMIPALDPAGYGWDTPVKGRVIDEISGEEARQMLPGTADGLKSIICSISHEEYEDANFHMTRGAMKKRMQAEMAHSR